MVRQQLSQDFSEMRSVSSENLLYIKEDLIIPHVSARTPESADVFFGPAFISLM